MGMGFLFRGVSTAYERRLVRPRAVVVGLGFGQPGAGPAFLPGAVGRMLRLIVEVALVEFFVPVALAFPVVPLLVRIREHAAMIAEVQFAAVAFANGLG